MPNFDINDYLAERMAREGVSNKLTELAQASEAKKAELLADREKAVQKLSEISALNAAHNASWQGQLGVDSGTSVGNRINDVASFVSGASRLLGQTASLVPNIDSFLEGAQVDEKDVQAFNRYKANAATADDMMQLNRLTTGNVTALQHLQNAEHARNVARSINDTTDLSSIVDQGNRKDLNDAIGKDFEANWEKVKSGKDVVGGIAGILYNTAAGAWKNPAGLREYIIENAPQLFIGAAGKVGQAGMLASNLGYAADNYQQGIENYAKANNGALPPEDVRRRMAWQAASLAAAEEAGDLAGLHGAKLLGMGEKTGADAARTSFLQSMKNVGKGAAEGFLGEAPTEGYQQYMEGEVTGKPVTAKEIWQAGVIGGLSGAGLSGGARLVVEGTGNSEAHIAQRQQALNALQAQQQAIQSGDVSGLVDTAPDAAVAALFGHSQQAQTDEAKQGAYAKAAQILTDLQQTHDLLAEKHKMATNPEAMAQLDKDIEQFSAVPEAAALAAKLKVDKEQLSDPQKIESKLNETASKLANAREAFKAFTAEQNKVTPEELQADLQAIRDNADPEAAKRFVNLAMADTVDLGVDTLREMATNKAFTPEQQDYLRALSETRQAENAMKGQAHVTEDILTGSKPNAQVKYTGIAQYRQHIAAALQARNIDAAQSLLGKLGSFAADHQAKANAVTQAAKMMASARSSKEQVQVLRHQDGSWILNQGKQLPQHEVAKNGGMTIHPNTPATVPAALRSEAKALAAAHAELAAAIGLKTSPQEASHVADQAQPQSPAVQSQSEQPGASAPQAAAASTGASEETGAPFDLGFAPDHAQPVGEQVVQPTTHGAPEAQPVVSQEAQPTPDRTAQAEGAVQEHAQEQQQPETSEPTLTVFEHKGTADTPYHERNLVADFFKQVKAKLGMASARPLASVKDFLSKWKAGEISVESFLDDRKGPLTDKQQEALAKLRDDLIALSKDVRDNLQIDTDYLKALASGDPQKISNSREMLGQDMMQFFLRQDEHGNAMADENVVTAIAYAAHNWLLRQSMSPATLSTEQINSMMGRQAEDGISDEGVARLRHMISHEDYAIAQMGKVVRQALGLRPNNQNVPQDLQARLDMAFGTHALLVLEKQGVIQRETIFQTEMDPWFGIDSEQAKTDPRKNSTFIKLADNARARNALNNIRDENTGTGMIVEKLFGVEHAPKLASTEKAKFTDVTARDSKQKISDMQRRAIQQTMNTPHKAIPAMLKIALAMPREVFLKMAGYEEFNPAQHSVAHKEAMEAKNEQLKNQYDLMMEMLKNPDNPDGMLSSFFVQQYVMKNFRAGFTTDSLNQQTSKIHRFMFARPDWTATLHLDNANEVNDFKVAFAQSIGVSIDKQLNAATINDKLTAELAKEDLQRALAVVRKHVVEAGESIENVEQWSPEDAEAVTSAAASREGMMTLQGLVAYAKYQQAMETNAGKVDITMLVGADGKTSGPMLTHLALGAGASVKDLMDTLAMGGMYPNEEGAPKHFADYYRQPGAMDLYESLGARYLKHAKDVYLSTKEGIQNLIRMNEWSRVRKLFTQEEWAALETLTGTLFDGSKTTKAGRNLTKTPLTSFGFGSGLGASVRGMQEKLFDAIYTTAEDIATGRNKDVTVQQLTAAVNTLLIKGGRNLNRDVALLPENLTTEKWLAGTFTKAQKEALFSAFESLVGNAVKDTMKGYFATLIDRRNGINKTTQAAFFNYHTLYQSAREKEIARLVETGEIAHRLQRTGKEAGKKVPLHDMTAAQETAFRNKFAKLLPTMHSAYSQQQGDLAYGLYLAKSGSAEKVSPLYKNKVYVKNRVKNANGDMAGHLTPKPYVPVEMDPGVIGSSYPIHASDSFIMHNGLLAVPQSMNIHDEIGNNFLKIKDAARAVNKSVVDTFLDYSPARAAYDMFERTTLEAKRLIENGLADKEVVPQLMQAWTDLFNRGMADTDQTVPSAVTNVLPDYLFYHAQQADKLRLQALSQMGVVDQYPWEGGQFNDAKEMEAIRKEAAARLEKLDTAMSPELVQAIAYLEGIRSELAGEKTEATQLDGEQSEGAGQLENTAQIGLLGASAAPIVEALSTELPTVAKAVANGSTVEEAVNALPVGERAAAMQTIARIADQIAPNTITAWGLLGTPNVVPDTQIESWLAKNPKTTVRELIPMLRKMLRDRANSDVALALLDRFGKAGIGSLPVFYVTPNTDPAIAPNGIAAGARGWYAGDGSGIYVKSSDFITSGVKPELLLHELVHAALAAAVANPTAASKPFIAELQTLLKAAQKYVGDNGLTQHGKKITNVDELLAYGLTDETFQKEVLQRIEMPTKTTTEKMVDGLKAFVAAVSKFLFGTVSPKAENGMMVLITNAAGLFAEANKANKAAAKQAVNHAMAANAQPELTTLDLHEALANPAHPTDPAFAEHLKGLLSTMVARLHGPFGSFLASQQYQQATTPLDAWLKALYTGAAPFASKAYTAGFLINDQQAFAMEQVEATVKAALETPEVATRSAYAQLTKLYDEARGALKVQDFHAGNWATATVTEKERAQALHDFLFTVEQDNTGRSDYLARFVALGLTQPQVFELLNRATSRPAPTAPRSLADRLQKWFENVLQFFQRKITGTFAGQPMNAQLHALASQLVDIEATRRMQVIKRQNATSLTEPIETAVAGAVKTARQKIVAVASSPSVKNAANGYVMGAAGVVRTLAGGQMQHVLDAWSRVRDMTMKERHGIVTSLVNEVKGFGKQMQLLALAAKHREGERQRMITQHARAALDAFADGGKNLTKEQKAAISAVFMRTGAHNLFDVIPFDQWVSMLTNPADLQAKIAATQARLTGSARYLEQMIEQSNGLGLLRSVGRTPVQGQLLNAHNIARLLGTPYASRIDPSLARSNEKVLAQLITLYALKHSDSVDKQHAATVLQSEMNRADGGNGIEYVLRTLKHREQLSKELLFNNNPIQMIHGYVPEILDPHAEVTTATLADGQQLEDMGYVRGHEIPRDPKDTDQSRKYLYVRKGAGLQRYQTGAISLTDLGTKGSLQHDGHMSLYTQHGLANAQLQAQLTVDAMNMMRDIANRDPQRDMQQDPTSAMVPLLDDQGNIVNWRYMMQEHTKDTVLNRDNRFEHLLGAIDGALFDKTTTSENNAAVLQALHQEYTTNFATRSDSFVTISSQSADPELREIWNLLPHATKQDVRRIWGQDGMHVRIDMLDLVFGYRKWSASTLLEKANKERSQRQAAGQSDRLMELKTINAVSKIFVGVVEWGFENAARMQGMNPQQAERYAKQAAWRVAQAERGWQEVVKEVKDIYVIKNVTTLIGNIRSNMSLLFVRGVPLSSMVKYHLQALKGATAWQRDQLELTRLQAMKSAGYLPNISQKDLDDKIVRLQDALARNPIRPMVEMGLMPTIVEDLSQDDNPYSYKGQFQEWAEAKTARIPKPLKTAGRWMYMTHDTGAYQVLSRITQLSDFVGRYTLLMHLMERKNNPLSFEDAVLDANASFVNYDTPMNRGLQYLDDMGFIMFTKYFLRMQRVIGAMLKEHPARIIGLKLLDHYMDLGPIVTDSSFIAHFGNNPVESGAFEMLHAPKELATVKAFTLLK